MPNYVALLQKIKNPKTFQNIHFSSCFGMNALYISRHRAAVAGAAEKCDWLFSTLATAPRRPPHLNAARGRRASGGAACPPSPARGPRIGRASSPEQPLAGRLDPSTPTGGVRFWRRLYLNFAAVRGLYTIDRPTLITLACRAASNPPARAARAAALRGLSPLSCSRTTG